MIIAKNTNRASQILQSARNIKCFSLRNGFCGEPLTDRPMIYGEPREGETHRPLVEVSQVGFLRHELRNSTTKLHENGSGVYTIRVHSNLWYEFTA